MTFDDLNACLENAMKIGRVKPALSRASAKSRAFDPPLLGSGGEGGSSSATNGVGSSGATIGGSGGGSSNNNVIGFYGSSSAALDASSTATPPLTPGSTAGQLSTCAKHDYHLFLEQAPPPPSSPIINGHGGGKGGLEEGGGRGGSHGAPVEVTNGHAMMEVSPVKSAERRQSRVVSVVVMEGS